MAKGLLKNFGSIRGVFEAELCDLVTINGIGEKSAIAIKVIRAINNLYLQESLETSAQFNNLQKSSALWRSRLLGLQQEVFEVAYLDADLCLMKDGIERLETGTVAATTVYPRKVAEAALKRRANAIIMAHNHTSGSAHPSDYDERMTRRMKIALHYLDIKLVDHIIVAKNEIFSFAQNELL